MIAVAAWLALAAVQTEPPKQEANPAAGVVEDGKAKEPDEKRQARIGAGRMLFKDLVLLSILSILIMTLGLFMYISRNAQRLKNQKKAKPVKYYDLSIDDGPEPPPHEPSAEERLGGRN